MQKSYVVKSPINFSDFGFFVRVGDILVHDTANHNRLTVYRNGEIVKSITQTSLGMAALVKNQFITEVTASAAPTPQTSPSRASTSLTKAQSSPSKTADAVPTLKKVEKKEPVKAPVIVPEPELVKAKTAEETV